MSKGGLTAESTDMANITLVSRQPLELLGGVLSKAVQRSACQRQQAAGLVFPQLLRLIKRDLPRTPHAAFFG